MPSGVLPDFSQDAFNDTKIKFNRNRLNEKRKRNQMEKSIR